MTNLEADYVGEGAPLKTWDPVRLLYGASHPLLSPLLLSFLGSNVVQHDHYDPKQGLVPGSSTMIDGRIPLWSCASTVVLQHPREAGRGYYISKRNNLPRNLAMIDGRLQGKLRD
jgi:hypothetical protein